MKTVLGSVFATALMFSAGAAMAADKVQGTLTGIDVPSRQFIIQVDGNADDPMNFRVTEDTDLQQFLGTNQDGAQVTVVYDSDECADNLVCVSTASEISALN